MSDALPAGFKISEDSGAELPQGFELNEDKYGGVSGAFKSAALGAASGATLGLSDVALTKTGLVSPNTMQGLQEENPGSYMAGQVAGTVGSLVAAPEFSPAALIGKGGKAVTGGLKTLKAMQIAEDGTKAAKVLGAIGDIGAHAAGSAVEGAAYAGIGNTLNEYALGDPNLNGEKIMGNFGKGALWGGALGGALKTAAIAAPPALRAAKEGLVGLRDLVIGTGEGGNAGLIGHIAPDSKFTEALGNRMTNLGVDQQNEIVNKATSKLNAVHSNTQTAIRDLNENLRPEEINALIDTADPKKVNLATQEILDEINGKLAYMDNNPGLFSPNASAKLNQWHSQITNNLGESSMADRFNLLKDVKQGLGNWGYGIMDVTKGDTRNVLTGLSKSISDKLKNPDIFGFVGSSYEAHDNMLKQVYDFIGPNGKPTQRLSGLMSNVGSKAKPRFEFDSAKVARAFKQADTLTGQTKLENLNSYFDMLKQLPEHLENTHANVPNSVSFSAEELSNILEKHQQDVGEAGQKYLAAVKNSKGGLGLRDMLPATIAFSHPLVGAAITAYNIITHPLAYTSALAEVERMVGKTTQAMAKGAQSALEPTTGVIGKTIPVISGSSSKEAIEKHKETRDQLSQLVNDPNLMIEKLNDATEHLHSVAPDTTAGLQQSMIRATQFLLSKMPNHQQASPFQADYIPSQNELSKFNNYLSIVEKPTHAYQQIKDGMLGPETIETLQVVYPSLYAEMKASLIKEATKYKEKDKPIPYRTKEQVSFFIGQPLDSSLNQQSILMNQMSFASKQQTQDQANPSKTGMKDMTIASRTKVQQEHEA